MTISTDPSKTGIPQDRDQNWIQRGAVGGGQVWLQAPCQKGSLANLLLEVNKMYAIKLQVRKRVPVDMIRHYVKVAAGAGGLLVHAIFRDQGGGVQWPTSLIVASFVSKMATDAGNDTVVSSEPDLVLDPGDYYVVIKCGVAAPEIYGLNSYLLEGAEFIFGPKDNFDTAACIKIGETFQRTITAITQADPGVITSAGHGFSNGDRVLIHSVGGMVELNDNVYTVANKSANTFELVDDAGDPVDTTGFTEYTAGGAAIRMPATFPAATGSDFSSDLPTAQLRPTV